MRNNGIEHVKIRNHGIKNGQMTTIVVSNGFKTILFRVNLNRTELAITQQCFIMFLIFLT